MKKSYSTGLQGEAVAEEYLANKGMVCLERRHREKVGEIDLSMKDRDTIVFVEVKTRLSDGSEGYGLQSVDGAKQRRIAKSATLYLMKHGLLRSSVRFDVVEINQLGVIHINDAFQPGGMMF